MLHGIERFCATMNAFSRSQLSKSTMIVSIVVKTLSKSYKKKNAIMASMANKYLQGMGKRGYACTMNAVRIDVEICKMTQDA